MIEPEHLLTETVESEVSFNDITCDPDKLPRIDVDSELVLAMLDEVILGLIAAYQPINGQALLDALDEHFSTTISQGTLYPRLHDMRDDDVVEVEETVRAKYYHIGEGFTEDHLETTIAEFSYMAMSLNAMAETLVEVAPEPTEDEDDAVW